MPTIAQLPEATQVGNQDEIPVSQAGTTRSVTVGELLAGTQPALSLASGAVLGRASLGSGSPEAIPLGAGLQIASGVLSAMGTDHLGFAVQPQLGLTDEVVLNSAGVPKRMSMPLMRGLFTPGANVSIGPSGQISAATDPSVTGSLSSLSAGLASTQASVAVLSGEIPQYGYVTLNEQGQVTAPVAADVSAGTVLPGPGATPRTLAARAADVVNVLDFGAQQGGPDCTAAFAAAFAAMPAAGGEIFVPPGDYWLMSPLVFNGKPIAIRGSGKGITRLRFAHTGIGFDIATGNLFNRACLRDFTAYAESRAGQTAAAIRLTFPAASSFGYQTARISHVECIGDNGGGTAPFPRTFLRAVVLNGCWSTLVENLSSFGPATAPGASSSYAVELNSSTDTRLHHLHAHSGAGAVIQTGYCQGIYLHSPLVVSCDYFMTQTDETKWPGYTPNTYMLIGLWIIGGESNTSLGFLQLANVAVGWVIGMDISRDTGPTTSQTFFALTSCSKFHILGCGIVGGGGGAIVDVGLSFASTWNSASNIIGGCHFENVATAINIIGTNGTVGLMAFGLALINVPLASAFIDPTPPANNNCIQFHAPSNGSAASGIGNTQDHVLAGAQGQALFQVNNVASSVNLIRCQAATSGVAPALCFDGTDAAVGGMIQTKGRGLTISAAGGGSGMGNLLALQTAAGATNYVQVQNAAASGSCVIATNAGPLTLQPSGSLVLSAAGGLFAPGLPTVKPASGSGQVWNNNGVLNIA